MTTELAQPVIKSSTFIPLSQACSYGSLTSPKISYWVLKMRPYWDETNTISDPPLHRKIWEWAFITSALADMNVLKPGFKGVGFGVGKEPLVPLFASLGANILATDQSEIEAENSGWKDSNQYGGDLNQLNSKSLCDPIIFNQNVSFRTVDMRNIPEDIKGFDFNWSSCAFEHLGSIDAGLEFIVKQLDTLKPGGIAVHTTEFNVSSNSKTVESGPTVLFRRRDLELLESRLQKLGHHCRFDFSLGETEYDLHVDRPPYQGAHLRLEADGYVITSFGIVIRKREEKESRFRIKSELARFTFKRLNATTAI